MSSDEAETLLWVRCSSKSKHRQICGARIKLSSTQSQTILNVALDGLDAVGS